MDSTKVNKYLSRHEQVLQDVLITTDIPAERLKQAIQYSLFPGGKRIRPILVYLCGEILEIDLNTLDIIAVAIELIHSFSLVHDDLPAMDDDDYRRDKLSCHREFDEATAILAGDGMHTLAIEVLMEKLPKLIEPAKVIQVTEQLLKACGPSGMVSGQSLDMTELSKSSIDETTLLNIHSLKTGKLITVCFKMPLAACDPATNVIKALNDFAELFGTIFQMQDDYLDQYDDTNSLGKCRSSDIANEKLTFASIFSKEELAQKIQTKIADAKSILDTFGSKAEGLSEVLAYIQGRFN